MENVLVFFGLLVVVSARDCVYKLDGYNENFLKFEFDNLDLSDKSDFQLTFSTTKEDVILYYVEGQRFEGLPLDYEGLFIREGKLNYFIFNPSEFGAGSSFGSHVKADIDVNNGTKFDVRIYRNKEVNRTAGGKTYVTGMAVGGETFEKQEVVARGGIKGMNLNSTPGKVTVWVGGHPDLHTLSKHLHAFTGEMSGLKEMKSGADFPEPASSSQYVSNSCDPTPPS